MKPTNKLQKSYSQDWVAENEKRQVKHYKHDSVWYVEVRV